MTNDAKQFAVLYLILHRPSVVVKQDEAHTETEIERESERGRALKIKKMKIKQLIRFLKSIRLHSYHYRVDRILPQICTAFA